MQRKNEWLEKVEQEVKVTLKKRGYRPTGGECNYDVDGSVPLIVKIKRYAMTHNEKLATIIQTSLKYFANELNGYGQDDLQNYIVPVQPDEEKIVIDDKFLKWIAGETATAYLDKNHKMQYSAPTTIAKAMEEAKESCPQFLNEKIPNTRSMTDLKSWVIEKQRMAK